MRLLLIGGTGFIGGHVARAASAAGVDLVTAGRGGGDELAAGTGPERPDVGRPGVGRPDVGRPDASASVLDRAGNGASGVGLGAGTPGPDPDPCPDPGPGPGPARHLRLDLAESADWAIHAVLAEVEPDAVVNCAGATDGPPAQLAACNVLAPAALARAMLWYRPACRLVHVGSAAEYGWVEPGAPVVEATRPRPVGPYGVSKLGGTHAVLTARAAGLNAVVLRVFNPVGPGAGPQSLPGRAVAELARVVAEGGSAHFADLSSVRDFVDVTDVAAAVLAAATRTRVACGLLNVGSGVGVSGRELVATLAAVAGLGDVPITEGNAGSSRSPAVPWQQANIQAARAALGWRPTVPLRSSLANLWESSR